MWKIIIFWSDLLKASCNAYQSTIDWVKKSDLKREIFINPYCLLFSIGNIDFDPLKVKFSDERTVGKNSFLQIVNNERVFVL